ncbi:MAG: hypothetical protein ACYCZS_11500 [Thiobacillus sp.]
MLLSPVNFEHYVLNRVDIEPVEDYVSDDNQLYPDFQHAKFKVEINVAEVNGQSVPNSPAYQITLALFCDPKTKNSFPYRFRVGVTGFITFRGDQVGQERTDLVTVNGCALLYGTLRDVIHTFTMRFRNGPVMLPTVTFVDMRQNAKKSIVTGAPAAKKAKKPGRSKESLSKA